MYHKGFLKILNFQVPGVAPPWELALLILAWLVFLRILKRLGSAVAVGFDCRGLAGITGVL